MKKFLSAFVLAGAVTLALPATGHATIVGSAPVVVLGNIVYVQVQITESRGEVFCGVIIQTRTQPPVAAASAQILVTPSGPNGAVSGSWTSPPLPNGNLQVAVTCADDDGPSGVYITEITIPGFGPFGSS